MAVLLSESKYGLASSDGADNSVSIYTTQEKFTLDFTPTGVKPACRRDERHPDGTPINEVVNRRVFVALEKYHVSV